MKTHRISLAFLFAVALSTGGCPLLQQVPGQNPTGLAPHPPRIRVAAVTLVEAPTNAALTGYFCPQVAPGHICRFLAPPPPPNSIKFVFDIALDVENPNTIPLPLVEALAAFTVFPDSGQSENLGAVCLSMCQDPRSCPPRADACSARGPEVQTADDFARAAVGFLFSVATGQASLDNLSIKTIPASGTARVTFRLELNPTSILNLVKNSARDALGTIARGQKPQFQIPYRIEGSAWIEVEGLAKIGAPFPAYTGTWRLL